jgi:hypothetical protein
MSKGEAENGGPRRGLDPSLRIGPVVARFALPTHTASAAPVARFD